MSHPTTTPTTDPETRVFSGFVVPPLPASVEALVNGITGDD